MGGAANGNYGDLERRVIDLWRSKAGGGSVIGRHGPVVAVAILMLAGTFQPRLVLAGQIRWRGQTVATPTQSEAELTGAIAALAGRADARHVVVQFDQPIDARQRADLAAEEKVADAYYEKWQKTICGRQPHIELDTRIPD